MNKMYECRGVKEKGEGGEGKEARQGVSDRRGEGGGVGREAKGEGRGRSVG